MDAGQPVTFDVGAYPKVFAVNFDPATFPVITWDHAGPRLAGVALGRTAA